MASAAIHIVPDDSFDDWVVRGDIGPEFGHFPTREAAELAAEAIAREREAELIIYLPDGRTSRKSFRNGWAARLREMIGRNLTDACHALTPLTCSRVHAKSSARGMIPHLRAISRHQFLETAA